MYSAVPPPPFQMYHYKKDRNRISRPLYSKHELIVLLFSFHILVLVVVILTLLSTDEVLGLLLQQTISFRSLRNFCPLMQYKKKLIPLLVT